MVELVINEEHLRAALGAALERCRHRLLVSTADLKNLHVPPDVFRVRRRRKSSSIVEVFRVLGAAGTQIHLLHGGVPSGPFIDELKKGLPENFIMRHCPRVHAKAVIADGRFMYLGSANVTGAGLGAKGPARRNVEFGICTDEITLIDPVVDELEEIFQGRRCAGCGRKSHCYQPLEEPDLVG